MVLVVEDDETLRGLMGKILEMEKFEVRFAENGLVAKTILTLNQDQFDLVITDVRMPEMDGATLLKDVRAMHPKTRFIVTTGFSEILDAKHAIELGANDFLHKPFKTKDLLDSIQKVLNPPEVPAGVTLIEEDEFSFCKIHVDEFTSASVLASDIYVRLADNKFIKVAREGAEIQVQRIQTYKEKKVEYFYVLVKDFQKYAGFALRLAKAAAASKKITREQKLKLYKHTTEILLTQLHIDEIRPEAVEFSQNILSNTLNLIGDAPETFDLLLLLEGTTDYAHSVAVSVYSCLIAKKLHWNSQQTLTKLSLGGLMHDIGKKEISPRILAKSRRDMTADEIALYESHAQRGKDILASILDFPGEVIQIVYQHHENNLGTGYPLGTSPLRIHPLAKIIHLVDEFIDTTRKYQGQDPKPWHAALKEIWEMKASEFDPVFLKALMELFSYPVPGPLQKVKLAS